ncbi:hypothetical protein [Streptomyces sp. NPDC019890]|uniref:hypothetical protein n=1 Tax=Streptomyces sp. NPDC019890 TaxID=3365064 RepID=UPI00384E8519
MFILRVQTLDEAHSCVPELPIAAVIGGGAVPVMRAVEFDGGDASAIRDEEIRGHACEHPHATERRDPDGLTVRQTGLPLLEHLVQLKLVLIREVKPVLAGVMRLKPGLASLVAGLRAVARPPLLPPVCGEPWDLRPTLRRSICLPDASSTVLMTS